MTIINNLDLGAHPTWKSSQSTRVGPVWGSDVQEFQVAGAQSIIVTKDGAIRKRTETVWVTVPSGDPKAVLRLVRQLKELSNNPNMQPVYIQWASGGGNIIVDPEDGWYTLESVTPDEEIAVDGTLPVQIVGSYLNPGLASRALAISYIGGPAAIGWGGPTQNWLSYPMNVTGVPFLVQRFGAEGYIPISYSLPMSALTPQTFQPSSTINDLFKGRVAIYDTVNTSSFPIPTSGAYINSGWVEVLHPDHPFLGDCVITNGLILLFLGVGTITFIPYIWNINTSAWLSAGTVQNQDISGFGRILKSVNIGRISFMESSVKITCVSPTSSPTPNDWTEIVIRVLAGSNYIRIQLRPLSASNANETALNFYPGTAPRIAYTDCNVLDPTLTLEQNVNFPICNSGFGYIAGFANNSAQPFIYGWLYLNNTNQQFQGANNGNAALAINDSTLVPQINQFRSYGFFLAPYTIPQSLQAEGESGSLGTGWNSSLNVNASAGSEARAASGTTAGNADLFGTAFVPPTGAYDIWFRMRVLSNAGTQKEMTLGLWDTTNGSYAPGGSQNFSANQIPTGYTGTGSNWIKVNPTTPLVPPLGHQVQFRAVTALTLGTDWFVDEAVIVPIKMLPSFDSMIGPQEIWSEFAFDRRTKIIPLS